MEQFVRDMRAASIYEGTTGIQGLDLLGRKVLATRGETLQVFTQEVLDYCNAHQENKTVGPLATQLKLKVEEWLKLTLQIGTNAIKSPNEVGAASVDYLMYSGYCVLGYMWLQMAVSAETLNDAAFSNAKQSTAQFYFERILPRTLTHKASMESGSANLMTLEPEAFSIS